MESDYLGFSVTNKVRCKIYSRKKGLQLEPVLFPIFRIFCLNDSINYYYSIIVDYFSITACKKLRDFLFSEHYTPLRQHIDVHVQYILMEVIELEVDVTSFVLS